MKKILWALGIVVLLAIVSIFIFEKWLVKTLPERLNSNEDRSYDVIFEDVNVQLLRRSIELQGISIQPLKENMATTITGTMKSLRLGGVNLLGFVFGDVVEINEFRFEAPKFILVRNDSISKNPADVSKAFQGLFGDLVSRGVIHNFILNDGSGEFYTKSDSLRKFGSFEDFRISAVNLETDSVRLNYAIPFKLESIETSLKNLLININQDQTFTLGSLNYDSKQEAFDFFDLQLKYDDSSIEASRRSEIQKDFIEIDVKHLRIEQIKAQSNIYGSWAIVAGLMTIDSLYLHDVRNKNKSRPYEPEKPMFEGMVEQIPFPIQLDTIKILNSKITYSEISDGKSEPGNLNFEQLSGIITHAISLDSLQSGEMLIHGEAVLNGFAPLRMDVVVPYGNDNTHENFHLEASVDPFSLPSLNGILGDLVSVNINSGTMEKLEITMDASRYSSSNSVIFHYSDLKLELRDEEAEKKKLMSTLANILTSNNNLPENNNYKTAQFQTQRNIYRGTFNLIWESLREGMLEIVPGDLMQLLMKEQDPSDKGKRR
ncbi:hypothetical protein SYJ56_20160 [Algoriphagus sp. D3-2-R+10]|uniref:hypothetical protein n=1 Tax=Algoriphagus aurantiacus TaxID=3103948 RepID=UPI002B381C2F|nr:hypothetical protein [Algoriphagus sp. D3-2-R+10]MEB2777642.1 hypothetical protein [Algoriphagus sp. D3-2-R+10]